MDPFQQVDELSWQDIISSDNIASRENDKVNELWRNNHNNVDTSAARVESLFPRQHVHNNNRARSRSKHPQRSSLLLSSSPNDNIISDVSTNIINDIVDEDKKKMLHREIERQRRQEMSQLCASLYSILPSHYTKGKRATSDHLEEAVNYIKELEKNVKELSDKKDKMKLASSTRVEEGGSSTCTPWSSTPYSVVIRPRQGGLDIEITTTTNQDCGFCLSNALQVVIEEGLSVATCTSTNVNDRVLHQIACEVTSIECINIGRLQQRLIDLVG